MRGAAHRHRRYLRAPAHCPRSALPTFISLTWSAWLARTSQERTVAHALRERGFDTGFVGKWHLSDVLEHQSRCTPCGKVAKGKDCLDHDRWASEAADVKEYGG